MSVANPYLFILRFLIKWRNRVISAGMKRVTFYKATESKITPSHNAISFNRLYGITRTGWIKTTLISKKRANKKLVALYRSNT
tara:strand:- start:22428 stop:22676 length:249 start_codon:yes stop_codon:yes gene_type:complete